MATTNYPEALAWLYALEAARGMDFKLERVALALRKLGDPHQRYPCVHIAGTNGKGSVAAMSHAMLDAAGYRTGLYVSPHLVSFCERIRVGTELISESEVVDLVQRIRTAATVRGIELTYFEFVTVMAFLHFADRQVDIAVIEVGLGGRLDATNVIEPLVSVITSIDVDHEEYLGPTVRSIAAEKCGIIKPSVPVVVGRVEQEAAAVIEETASDRHAPLYRIDDDFSLSEDGRVFRGMGSAIADVVVALRGGFQLENAAVAIASMRVVGATLPVADDAIKRGLARVEWPGRLEIFPGKPLVVADGAHNLAAIRRLVSELPAIVQGRPVRLLFAVMRDKRWQPMLDELLPLASAVTVTTALPGRSEPPLQLAAAIGQRLPVSVGENAEQALEKLLSDSGKGEAVLVTGSLFLIGQVYPTLSRRRQQHHPHASVE